MERQSWISSASNMTFPENVTKRQKINNEQQGSRDRDMGNTAADWSRAGSEVLEVNILCATREI